MVSALPSLPSSSKQDEMSHTFGRHQQDPIRLRRTAHNRSCEGTWTCWPNCGRESEHQASPVRSAPMRTTLDQTKQTGFTLFAVPPTPPVRKYYLTRREYIDSSETSSARSDTTDGTTWSSEDSLPPLPPHTPPELLPAPLRIRKFKPRSDSSSSFQTSPCRKRGSSAYKRASIRNSIIYPPANLKRMSKNRSPPQMKRAESRLSRLQSRTGLLGHKHKKTTSNAFSLSQWLDIEEGLVDRKKLSIYLGDVLGSSFQIPNLDHISDSALEPVTLDNIYRSSVTPGPLTMNPPDVNTATDVQSATRPCTATKCECTPGKILCQGKSSPEFKVFTRWPVFRKSQLSISSTACRLQVPRAQIEMPPSNPKTPPKAKSPPKLRSPAKLRSPTKSGTPPKSNSPQLREIALSSSPPDLVYDNPLHSDDLDWSMLRSSPRDEDIFRSSSYLPAPATPFIREALASTRGNKRYSSAPVVNSKPPPSSFKPIKTKTVRPETPDADLAVNSSLSSLEFDFDYDRSKHFQQPPSADRHRISKQVLHRHLRNTKTVLSTDRPALSTDTFVQRDSLNVATIARCIPTKPALVTHRISSSPMPIPYETPVDRYDDARMSYHTRVPIQRPPSDIRDWKRRSGLVNLEMQHQRTKDESVISGGMVQSKARPQSRITNNGSPVLGRTEFDLTP